MFPHSCFCPSGALKRAKACKERVENGDGNALGVMESSIASAKDTLQDLTSAVEIMKNNPTRFNLSVEDVAKRETQVQALRYVRVRKRIVTQRFLRMYEENCGASILTRVCDWHTCATGTCALPFQFLVQVDAPTADGMVYREGERCEGCHREGSGAEAAASHAGRMGRVERH